MVSGSVKKKEVDRTFEKIEKKKNEAGTEDKA